MANQLRARRSDAVRPDPFVMMETSEGWRVYSTANPKSVSLVTGTQVAPNCTCSEYANDPQIHCPHIEAAVMQLPAGNGHDGSDAAEREAIQEEGQTSALQALPPSENCAPSMTLKRSVSPDGRIDSLSVEFSCGVSNSTAGDIQIRATRLLKIQSSIVDAFLGSKQKQSSNGSGDARQHNGRQNLSSARPMNGGNSPVPARMVNVGGMNSKWGRRLFINVEVNGHMQRLFGKPEELVGHIEAAGYYAPQPFAEGAVLNVPCRVTTKPSSDGRYQNVDRVLPAENQAQAVQRQ